MKYDPVDIYYFFRKAQADTKGRGFRMPKDFDAHLNNKFTAKNREALLLATKYFNSKWLNVEPYEYFKCGFELYKTFSYAMFFRSKVLRLYIEKDKNKKRELGVNKRQIVGSVKYIKRYMSENKIFMLDDYLSKKDGRKKIIVDHYMRNKVDKFLLVYLIKIGKLILTDDDRAYMPYIIEQYREIKSIVEEMNGFLREAVKKM